VDERALARVVDDLELERTFENVLIGGMFSIMVVIILAQYMQSQAGARLESTATGYPALAGNSGLVWIQMTPAGDPNQVKIISENSTGAFEEVLLGLTT
jgi:hypothetical protein